MPASANPPSAVTGRGGRYLPGLARLVSLLTLLYLFLFAIALLGAAFKIFGSDFSRALITGTANPVIGLMIGLLATSLIQSSSSTTSIVVGLVAADALTVGNAIPIIMGANMGTTVTNTIVAMTSMNRRAEFVRAFSGATMHDFFNLLTICILFPLEMATHYLERAATWLSLHLAGSGGVEFHSPVKTAVKPAVKLAERLLTQGLSLPDWLTGTLMLIVSLACIFLALTFLTRLLRGVVLKRAEGAFSRHINSSGTTAMALGVVVTVAVQSSSITTSLLVPMIGAGIVPLEAAFAVTLGANIGTTVTALLASLAGNTAAVTVALVHLLFNISGILLIYPFRPLRRIPINMARQLAHRTARRRIYAIYYMLGIFFVLPLIFVLVTEAF
jgi:sodium-dependent phosphate cotransporter